MPALTVIMTPDPGRFAKLAAASGIGLAAFALKTPAAPQDDARFAARRRA